MSPPRCQVRLLLLLLVRGLPSGAAVPSSPAWLFTAPRDRARLSQPQVAEYPVSAFSESRQHGQLLLSVRAGERVYRDFQNFS